jgi:hypothetical protein
MMGPDGIESAKVAFSVFLYLTSSFCGPGRLIKEGRTFGSVAGKNVAVAAVGFPTAAASGNLLDGMVRSGTLEDRGAENEDGRGD